MLQEQLNLFAKHFSGETSEKENKEIELLLRDNKLKEEYKELSESWEKSINLKSNFNVEQGLQILKSKISKRKLQIRRGLFLRVAAIFVGLIFVSSVLFIDSLKHTTIVATNSVEKITLPDSSIIYLNKGSEIDFKSANFQKFNRKVKLTGEAYFEIKKDSNKKFIVNIDCFDVQVLGTKFNVKTIAQNSEITLNEGNVRLFNFPEKQDDIYMAPNDYVAYNKESNTLTKNKVNAELYSIWKEKYISFENFNLDEVSQIIEQVFNKQVIINNQSLSNKTLSGSAPIDNLSDLLKALSEILGEEILVENDTIIIN